MAFSDPILRGLEGLMHYEGGQDTTPLRTLSQALRTMPPGAERSLLLQAMAGLIQGPSPHAAKQFATEEVMKFGGEDLIPYVTPLLNAPETVQYGVAILQPMDHPQIDALLLAQLENDAPAVRLAIIDTLGERKAEAALPALAKRLSNAPSLEETEAIVTALGKIGSSEATNLLSEARPNLSPELQGRVDEALLAIAQMRWDAGETDAALVLAEEIHASAATPEAQATALRLILLQQPSRSLAIAQEAVTAADWERVTLVVDALSQAPDAQAIDYLVAAFPDLPAKAQCHIAGLCAQIGRDSFLPRLHEMISAEDADLRIAALLALRFLGDESSVPVLLNMAIDPDTEREETFLARAVLDTLPGATVDAAILARYEGAAAPLQADVLRALAARGVRTGIPLMLESAQAEEEVLWKAALNGLASLATLELLPELVGILQEADGDRKRNLAQFALRTALMQLESAQERLAILEQALSEAKTGETSVALYELLGQAIGAEAVPLLIQSYRESDVDQKVAVVRTLSRLPSEAVLEDLFALAEEENDPRARAFGLQGALLVFGRLSEALSQQALLDSFRRAQGLVQDEAGLKKLVSVVGGTGEPLFLSILAPYLQDPAVKEEAVRAIHDIIYAAATVTATVDQQDMARNVSDRDIDTAWSMAKEPEETVSVMLDLGRPFLLRHMILDASPTPDHFPPLVRVYVSEQPGADEAPVAEVAGATVTHVPLKEQVGRYIRIEAPTSAEQVIWVLHEVLFLSEDRTQLGIEAVPEAAADSEAAAV